MSTIGGMSGCVKPGELGCCLVPTGGRWGAGPDAGRPSASPSSAIRSIRRRRRCTVLARPGCGRSSALSTPRTSRASGDRQRSGRHRAVRPGHSEPRRRCLRRPRQCARPRRLAPPRTAHALAGRRAQRCVNQGDEFCRMDRLSCVIIAAG